MALRRGIAGYANGTNDVVPGYADGTPDTSSDWLAQGMPYAPQPAQPPTGGGFSQVLSGQFGAAQQNPQASPATKAIAGLAEQAGRAHAASRLASPPSVLEHVLNFFTGNDATSADIARRQATANALGDPLVQQHMVAQPDALVEAQQNPDQFAAKTLIPEFRQTMQDAVNNHAIASQGIPVTDDAGNQRTITDHDPVVVGKTMGDHDLPPAAAVAASQGHLLSRDEFINSLRGTPTKIIQMLFGAQLGHVPQVHDIIAKTYFDAKEAELAKQRAAIAEMEKRADPKQSSALTKMKADLLADEKAHVQEMGIYSGVYQRPYVMAPGQQQ